jgi:hypothetical protein
MGDGIADSSPLAAAAKFPYQHTLPNLLTQITIKEFKRFGSPASLVRLEPLTFVAGARARGPASGL